MRKGIKNASLNDELYSASLNVTMGMLTLCWSVFKDSLRTIFCPEHWFCSPNPSLPLFRLPVKTSFYHTCWTSPSLKLPLILFLLPCQTIQCIIIALCFSKSQSLCIFYLTAGWWGKHRAGVEGEDDRGQWKTCSLPETLNQRQTTFIALPWLMTEEITFPSSSLQNNSSACCFANRFIDITYSWVSHGPTADLKNYSCFLRSATEASLMYH